MSGTVTIAGIRFHVPVDATAHAEEFADLDVDVAWVDEPATESGTVLGAPSDQTVTIDTDGRLIVLRLLDDANTAGYWQLRQVAPIVAAWHRRLTLHASAVVVDDEVVVFVGGSGTGKSTLAWELTKAGATPVADDLVPVRFTADGPLIHTGEGPATIRAVCFLERVDAGRSIDLLAPSDAFRRHLRDGFGEHGHPDVWAYQFDTYHHLAGAVPHMSLRVPDDRAEVPDTARWLLGEIVAHPTLR